MLPVFGWITSCCAGIGCPLLGEKSNDNIPRNGSLLQEWGVTFRRGQSSNPDSLRTLLGELPDGPTSVPDGSHFYPNKYRVQATGDHLVRVVLPDFTSTTVLSSDNHVSLDARGNFSSVNRPISMVGTSQSCKKICAEKPQTTEICEKCSRLVHLSQVCSFSVMDRLGIITRYDFLSLKKWAHISNSAYIAAR